MFRLSQRCEKRSCSFYAWRGRSYGEERVGRGGVGSVGVGAGAGVGAGVGAGIGL